MLNISEKLIKSLSNKVSTLSFENHSHLHLPIIYDQFTDKLKSYPKSLLVTDDSLSYSTQNPMQSNIEQSIIKSKRSKESIQIKRSIIRKMNEKILELQKKTKTQKIDIFELQACKNDLLLDFLQYQQSKRKHQQQIHEKCIENTHDDGNSFIWTKKQPHQVSQIIEDKLENRNFNKKHSKILSIGHKEVQYQIKPIQIIVPIMKFIDVEIPLLNIGGSNKQDRQYEEANNQKNHEGLHLPLNSSRSELFYDHQRRQCRESNNENLHSDRSQQSYDYRNEVKSDRFFVEDQEIVSKFQQKDQIDVHDGCQKDCQVKSVANGSEIREHTNENDHKKNDLSYILSQQLRLNSSIRSRKSSNYQQRRINIENQTKNFYEEKVNHLQQQLRQKSHEINIILNQNRQFFQQIQKSNKLNEKQQQNLHKANQRILLLQQNIIELKRQLQESQKAAQFNESKLINEINNLSNELQSKNQQLNIAFQSLETVQRNSYNKQQSLLKQIQSLENHLHKMRDQVDHYKQKFHQEGIKLNFTEIEMIEEAIEDTKKMYETNLVNMKSIYESQISQLKQKVSNIESQNVTSLKNLQSIQKADSQVSKQPQFKVNKEEIQEIIDLYDNELQKRDNEIIQVRKQLYKSQSVLKKMSMLYQKQKSSLLKEQKLSQKTELEEQNSMISKIMLEILVQKNQDLEKSLAHQTTYRRQLTQKLLKLQKAIKVQKGFVQQNTIQQNIQNSSQLQNSEQKNFKLVAELTQQLGTAMEELEKQKKINEDLRTKLTENKPIGPKSQSKQISTLKNKVKRLTKYSQVLEQQIKDMFKLSDCDVHNKIVERLQQKVSQLSKVKKTELQVK